MAKQAYDPEDVLVVTGPHTDNETEIDLLELLYRLLENLKFIILAAVVGAILAGVYTFFFVTPMYEATSKLYVLNSGDSAINLSDLQVGTYLASDYQEVFKTWEVSESVLTNLGLDYTYSQLQSMLSVSNPSDTRILYITVTSSDPELAASISNEFASVTKKYIYETMATEEPNIMSVALVPKNPVSPNKTRNIILGFLLGGIVMAGIITVLFVFDDRIKTADDVARYIGLPTLAVVPVVENMEARKPAQKRTQRGKQV